MNKTKKREGRPALTEGEASVVMPIRFTREQRDKIRAHGGGKWVRELVDNEQELVK